MAEQYSDNIPFRNVTQGASTAGYVGKVIKFLEDYLPDFPSYFVIRESFTASEEDIRIYFICTYKENAYTTQKALNILSSFNLRRLKKQKD